MKKILLQNNVVLPAAATPTKSVQNSGVHSKLVLYIDYTKGVEASLDLQVGFGADETEFFFGESGTLTKFSLNATGKYRIVLDFYEQFARVFYNGIHAAPTGIVNMYYYIIPN